MKTKHSFEYWEKRQDSRLAYSERVASQTVSNIADVYDDSLERVQKKIDNIIKNYSKSIKMPQDKLKDLLSNHDVDKLLSDLTQDLIANGANTNSNMAWLRGNYLKRISNEQAIKLQLENERRIISENEKTISSLGYKKTIDQTYMTLAKDLSGKGKALSESAKQSMLTNRWVGNKNYSERVWDNTGELSKDVDRLINSSLLSGRSRVDIQNDLMEKYDVAKYRAEVLVRTEMNYFENQSELQSYKDLGVTHYLFFATRDNRTSSLCSSMDESRYPVAEAKAGLNYPPMHPNCRSGTLPDLEFEEDYRVYKNPITLEREKTTKSYDEWYESKRQAYNEGPNKFDIEVSKHQNHSRDKTEMNKMVNELVNDHVPKNIKDFQILKYENDVQFSRLKNKSRLYKSGIKNGTLLPENDIMISDDKFTKYLLDYSSERGKHKAHVIESVLGYNQTNYDELIAKIKLELPFSPMLDRRDTKFGTRTTIPIIIDGPNNRYLKLNTVWQKDEVSKEYRFITLTFDKKKG
ncbi:minor capsid protein [Erysipelothrix sp. HDW6A]|uniref:minor capsid protein n=1 Tax=Erysipelothrix sp. HDW6A TaxID=2714928 RepID=UPI00140C5DB3|nr:minor capsid protein [Erysipelothrix sp. HDW6A]QIK57776.1 minor capsid protein [Erysipelothrix sp. HDW6A]